jgi:hypothetical protein
VNWNAAPGPSETGTPIGADCGEGDGCCASKNPKIMKIEIAERVLNIDHLAVVYEELD